MGARTHRLRPDLGNFGQCATAMLAKCATLGNFESHPHRQNSQVQILNLSLVRPGLLTSLWTAGTPGHLHTDGVTTVTAD
jgi:hypothetical protein